MNTQGLTVSINVTFNSMEYLITHFQAMKEKFANNPQIYVCLLAAWYKFDKYYKLSDDTPAYIASILLHPKLRKAYLQKVWAPHNRAYVKPAIEACRAL
jgi:hypothetical protein